MQLWLETQHFVINTKEECDLLDNSFNNSQLNNSFFLNIMQLVITFVTRI